MEKIITEIKPIRSLLTGIETELLKRSSTPEFGLTTMPKLSQKIHGLKVGCLVIGARTSQGKSAMAVQIASDLSDQNIPTLFLSLEMTRESIIERLFCNRHEVDNFDLMIGKLAINSEYQAKWEIFKQTISKTPLLITDGLGKDFAEVLYLIENFNPKPRVIILDYVQMIRQDRGEREMLNEYIRKFRQICLQNKIVGILCSQVNRGILNEDNKIPTLEYLKGTGSLEEVADMVWLLSWDYFYTHNENKKNEYMLYIAKNRMGRTGKHSLIYIPEYYQFKEPETVVEENPIVQRVMQEYDGKLLSTGRDY